MLNIVPSTGGFVKFPGPDKLRKKLTNEDSCLFAKVRHPYNNKYPTFNEAVFPFLTYVLHDLHISMFHQSGHS